MISSFKSSSKKFSISTNKYNRHFLVLIGRRVLIYIIGLFLL